MLHKLANKATTTFGRQILKAQKHSPVLLFGAGVVGFGATVVLSCRATMKMDEVLREAEENDAKIEQAKSLNVESYTDEDAKKDGLTNKVKLAIKIARLYAPAAVTGILTLTALTQSHRILTRRNLALTSALGAVTTAFKDYRGRVVEQLGASKDLEFLYGKEEREIAVETDEGVAAVTVEGASKEVAEKTKGRTGYSFLFDEGNPNWQARPHQNSMFIGSLQTHFNMMLQGRGYVFLNEVLHALGFDMVPEGQIVGWLKGEGDDCVDFGIHDGDFDHMRFLAGDERSVWLEFNVCGPIWDKI